MTYSPLPSCSVRAGDHVILQTEHLDILTTVEAGAVGKVLEGSSEKSWLIRIHIPSIDHAVWLPCTRVHPLMPNRHRVLNAFDADDWGGYLSVGVGEYVTVQHIESSWAWGCKLVRRNGEARHADGSYRDCFESYDTPWRGFLDTPWRGFLDERDIQVHSARDF